jgi:hypothetical protein
MWTGCAQPGTSDGVGSDDGWVSASGESDGFADSSATAEDDGVAVEMAVVADGVGVADGRAEGVAAGTAFGPALADGAGVELDAQAATTRTTASANAVPRVATGRWNDRSLLFDRSALDGLMSPTLQTFGRIEPPRCERSVR